MSARSQKLRNSLGDSWGDAEYESDGHESIHSASDFGSDVGSGSDVDSKDDINEQHDVATPLPSRVTRASSNTPLDTPMKTPANRVDSRYTQSPRSSPRSQPRSFASTPGSNTLEPSFIMPSMYGSTNSLHNGSPLRNSQIRIRKRQLSEQSQPDLARSSPRISSRNTSSRMPPHHEDAPAQGEGPWYYLDLFRRHVLWPVLRYTFDVGGHTMSYLKPLIAGALALWLIAAILTRASVFLQTTVHTALTPLCIIPGSTYVLPFCATFGEIDGTGEPDFETLAQVQSKFEDILEESKDSSALPVSMKRSETAIRDIKTLVQFSKLPSKTELGVEFDSFIACAKEASGQLISYNARIGATVDKVISTNKWTLTMLQDFIEKESGVGMIGRVASALNPLSVFIAPPPTLQQRVFDRYINHLLENKEDITNLIQMAQSLLYVLTNLDERLDVISSIAARDDVHVSHNRDELLSQLWTKLGGNSAKRKDSERQLRLLKEVTSYRKDAVMHVGATLLKLQEIAAGLENLRDNVAAPEVLGYRDEVPITFYMEIIEKGVDRLQASRGEAYRIERQAYQAPLKDLEDERGLPGREDGPVVYAKVKGGKR